MSTSKKKDFGYCLMTLVKHRKKLRENRLLLVLLKLVITRPWLTVQVISAWLNSKLIDHKN